MNVNRSVRDSASQPLAEQAPLVVVVDDDLEMRMALCELMFSVGIDCDNYASTVELMAKGLPDRPGCLILDVRMPGISGLDLQLQLRSMSINKPIVFLTAYADIPMTVQAMKAGAVNFFTKPFRDQALLDAVSQAIALDVVQRQLALEVRGNVDRYGSLTPRERQIFREVAAGQLNKQIAFDLGISLITVKLHRANLMRKMGAKTIGELVRTWETLPRELIN